MPDDLLANTGTGGSVAVGGSANGAIQSDGDRDWFAVTLEAGRTYRFDLQGARTGDGTLTDPYLRGIHDTDGNLIAGTTNDDGGSGLNSRTFFTATADGTYYVAAGAYGNREGTYTLSVVAINDHAADSGTSGSVAVGGSATGEIQFNGDRDWFAVDLEAGRAYRFGVQGEPADGGRPSEPYLRAIYDVDGHPIAGTGDNGGGLYASRMTFMATADATYFVEAGAYVNGEGAYTLSVVEVNDQTDDTGTRVRVSVGGSATGEIQFSGDRDWFKVWLKAGGTYVVEVKGASTDDGTLRDPYLLGIHDARGNPIAGTTNDDDGFGLNSRTVFTATANGTHYVAAGAYGHHEGDYTLSVIEINNNDDYAAHPGTRGSVAVGGWVTGEVEFTGDRDWFGVDLEAGSTYRFELKGRSTDNPTLLGGPYVHGTLEDPYVHGIHDARGKLIDGTFSGSYPPWLYGADGHLIDGAGDHFGAWIYGNHVIFTATADATYHVAAGAYGNGGGTYRLSVTDLTQTDDYAADTGTEGSVAVGGSAVGDIEFEGDRDWFAVTLEAGRTYQIDLMGAPTGDGTLPDPYLRGIHDAAGNLIDGTTNDDGGSRTNSRMRFTADADATYYVAAGAYGISEGSYTLSVTDVSESGDDYAADTGTSGSVVVGGSATGEIQYGGDRDWFSVSLEAGTTYQVDLMGAPTGNGTLKDPYLHGIHDARGNEIRNTSNNDGGWRENSRVILTADADAAYYVAAGAFGSGEGTYTLSVEEVL